MARGEWRDARVWEGLMRDAEGNVVCGTMSNLFLRRGSLLMTPVLDRCGIAGVMRRWVLEQAPSLRLRPVERRLRWQEIGGAEEAFMTNAVAGIVSVAAIRARQPARPASSRCEAAQQSAGAPGARVSLRRIVLIPGLALLLFGAAAVLVWSGVRSLDEPLNVAAPLRFKVPRRAPASRVWPPILPARGVVAQPRAWVLYARWKGLASAIKAGEYEIEPGTTPRALLDKLVSGQVVLHSFTIVDGWRVQDLLSALRRNPDIVGHLARIVA